MRMPAMNPIMKKELRVGARTVKFLIALLLYTGFMSFLAMIILASGQGIYSYGYTYDITYSYADYSNFTGSILWLAFAQLAMVCLIMPILTAASISGEREKQTLDIMMTTPVSPFVIMSGKLGSSMVKLFMFLLCGLPAMSICFLYGGIQWYTLIIIYGGILVIAFVIGAIGTWCSALFQKTIVSIIVTLLCETILFLLPLFITICWISGMYDALIAGNPTATVVDAGFIPAILLICPIFGYVDALVSATNGYSIGSYFLVKGTGTYTTAPGMALIQKLSAPISILIAIGLGLLFLKLGANLIDRNRRRNSKLSH